MAYTLDDDDDDDYDDDLDSILGPWCGGSWDTSVRVVTELRDGRPEFDSWQV
jgi:hypothetical protein